MRWRQPDPAALGLVLLTGYFSFVHVRHIAFFVVAAVPAAAAALSHPRVVRQARVVVAALGLCVGAYFLPDAVRLIRDGRQAPEVNTSQFPVEAAAFIEEEGLRGNMFNQYSWGGYLLWRLAPRRVFIDGRNADPELLEAYRLVLAGDRRRVHGTEFWKVYLERYGVRYTVTSFFDPFSGELLGLIDVLLADPAWVPVFATTTAVVFAEDVPENREAIRRNALPREGCYPTLLEYTSRLIGAMPAYVPPYVARGDLLQRLGDRAAALDAYGAALRLAPEHPVARARVAALRGRREQGYNPPQ
jgi:tetratricopeptide (TPR) repeat protein